MVFKYLKYATRRRNVGTETSTQTEIMMRCVCLCFCCFLDARGSWKPGLSTSHIRIFVAPSLNIKQNRYVGGVYDFWHKQATSRAHRTQHTHTYIHFSWPGGRLQVWSLLCLSAAGRSFFVMSSSMGGEDGLTPKLVWLQQDQLNLLTQNSAYPWKVFPSFFLGKKWLGDITWGKDICSLASCSLQRAWSAKKCGVQLLFFDFKESSNITFSALLLIIIWNFL